jgi:large subunit ribosomal protein L21
MYAILEIGGRQYQVEVGRKISVNRLALEKDSAVSLSSVRLLRDGDAVKAAPDELSGVSVRAVVTRNYRGKKVRVFKHKRRTGFQKTRGHRQELTELLITDIFGSPEEAERSATPDSPSAQEAQAESAPEAAPAPEAQAEAAEAPAPEAQAQLEAAPEAAEAPAPEAQAQPESATEAAEAPAQEAAAAPAEEPAQEAAVQAEAAPEAAVEPAQEPEAQGGPAGEADKEKED